MAGKLIIVGGPYEPDPEWHSDYLLERILVEVGIKDNPSKKEPRAARSGKGANGRGRRTAPILAKA